MPFIQVSLLEGRSEQQKRAYMKAITDVTVDILGAAPDSVRVVLTEVDPLHWAVAGEPVMEWRAKKSQG